MATKKVAKKAVKKTAAPKKVGFAGLSKAARTEMARRGGLKRVANAKAKADAEAKEAKKAARAKKK